MNRLLNNKLFEADERLDYDSNELNLNVLISCAC